MAQKAAGTYNPVVSVKSSGSRKKYYVERNKKGEVVGATEAQYKEQQSKEEYLAQLKQTNPELAARYDAGNATPVVEKPTESADSNKYGAEEIRSANREQGLAGAQNRLSRYQRVREESRLRGGRNYPGLVEQRGRVGEQALAGVGSFFVGGARLVTDPIGTTNAMAETVVTTVKHPILTARQIVGEVKNRPVGIAAELGTGVLVGTGISKGINAIKPTPPVLIQEDALRIGVTQNDITYSGIKSNIKVSVGKREFTGVTKTGAVAVTKGPNTVEAAASELKLFNKQGMQKAEVRAISRGEYTAKPDTVTGNIQTWEIPKSGDYTRAVKTSEIATSTAPIAEGLAKTEILGTTNMKKIDIVGYRYSEVLPDYNAPEFGLNVQHSVGKTGIAPNRNLLNDYAKSRSAGLTGAGREANTLGSSGTGTTQVISSISTQQVSSTMVKSAVRQAQAHDTVIHGIKAGGTAGFGVTIGSMTIRPTVKRQVTKPQASLAILPKTQVRAVTGPAYDYMQQPRQTTALRPLQSYRTELGLEYPRVTIHRDKAIVSPAVIPGTKTDTSPKVIPISGFGGGTGSGLVQPTAVPIFAAPFSTGGFYSEITPKKNRRIGKLQGHYFPSLQAIIFNIKSPKVPKVLTGLNMRPIKV